MKAFDQMMKRLQEVFGELSINDHYIIELINGQWKSRPLTPSWHTATGTNWSFRSRSGINEIHCGQHMWFWNAEYVYTCGCFWQWLLDSQKQHAKMGHCHFLRRHRNSPKHHFFPVLDTALAWLNLAKWRFASRQLDRFSNKKLIVKSLVIDDLRARGGLWNLDGPFDFNSQWSLTILRLYSDSGATVENHFRDRQSAGASRQ